jgi:hypothetical protein
LDQILDLKYVVICKVNIDMTYMITCRSRPQSGHYFVLVYNLVSIFSSSKRFLIISITYLTADVITKEYVCDVASV